MLHIHHYQSIFCVDSHLNKSFNYLSSENDLLIPDRVGFPPFPYRIWNSNPISSGTLIIFLTNQHISSAKCRLHIHHRIISTSIFTAFLLCAIDFGRLNMMPLNILLTSLIVILLVILILVIAIPIYVLIL